MPNMMVVIARVWSVCVAQLSEGGHGVGFLSLPPVTKGFDAGKVGMNPVKEHPTPLSPLATSTEMPAVPILANSVVQRVAYLEEQKERGSTRYIINRWRGKKRGQRPTQVSRPTLHRHTWQTGQ